MLNTVFPSFGFDAVVSSVADSRVIILNSGASWHCERSVIYVNQEIGV
jgi:hypothetical protein